HLSRLVKWLLSEVKAKNWRRDTRLAIINRRLLSIWNWLLGAAGRAMVAAVNRAGVAAIEVMPARAIDMQGVAIAGRVRDVGQRLLHLVVQSRIDAGDDVIADADRHRQQHV